MSIWMFLKVFGDLCVYFSVISAFPRLFAHDFSLLWPAVLCAVGVGMASVLTFWGRGGLRFLGLLLPMASFLLTDSLVEVLILLPVIAYVAVIILRDNMTVEYYAFRSFFIKSLIALAFFFAMISSLSYFETATDISRRSLAYDGILRFGILYALDGVILLRMLRMGEESGVHDRAMNRKQMAVVMAGTGGLLVGFVAVERLLQEQATTVAQKIWDILMLAITVPFHVIGMLINALLPEENKGKWEQREEIVENATESVAAPLATEPVGQPVVPQEEVFPWWLLILVLLALAVVLVLMFRIFQGRRSGQRSNQTVREIQPQEQSRKVRRRSNRNKIRQYYREFLKEEQKKGLKLRTNQTSADILDSVAKSTNKQAASDLREVYLLARYDESGQITREQVERAKEALKMLREN